MNPDAISRVFTSRVQNYSLLTNITTFDTHSATHLTKFNVYPPKGRSCIQTKRRGKLDFSRRNINMQLCLTYHLSEFGFGTGFLTYGHIDYGLAFPTIESLAFHGEFIVGAIGCLS